LEKLVAIIDTMPDYGRRLALYLNAGRTFPYRAVVFADASEVEGYIKNDGVYAVFGSGITGEVGVGCDSRNKGETVPFE
jgi:hypothetical protein